MNTHIHIHDFFLYCSHSNIIGFLLQSVVYRFSLSFEISKTDYNKTIFAAILFRCLLFEDIFCLFKKCQAKLLRYNLDNVEIKVKQG